MGQTNIHKLVTILDIDLIFTFKTHNDKPLIACHKIDLDLVSKVTRIINSFHIWNFLSWYKLSSLGMEDFFQECRYCNSRTRVAPVVPYFPMTAVKIRAQKWESLNHSALYYMLTLCYETSKRSLTIPWILSE